MIRKMDKLGRITLPKEWRNHAGIGIDNYVEMSYDEEEEVITLRKTDLALRCQFCGEMKKYDIIRYKHALVCEDCLEDIKRIKD